MNAPDLPLTDQRAAPGTGPEALAGRVTLRPGPGPRAVVSTRPDWVPRLARGQSAAAWPGLLATVFSLCGHAHRWAAQQAIAAAQGRAPVPTDEARQRHRLATAREQVLRITQDWPALLPGEPAAPAAAVLLRACPLWRDDWAPADRLAAWPDWLAQKWLGQPPADWLKAHEDRPDGAAALAWAQRQEHALARLLRRQWPALVTLTTPACALAPLREPAVALPWLAQRLHEGHAAPAGAPAFAQQPHWRGEVPDTGPWSRHGDPLWAPAHHAGTRLLARLVEVLRLAAPQGAHWLDLGAMPLGPGRGIAWIEMARGLLVHHVALDPTDPGRLLAAQVLAPTEWNFHPQGVLAQALQRLPAADADGARRLAVAFDPCVAFDIDVNRSPDHA
ncbi:hydrogenase formation protein [Ideonella livida]|uniref:Hydrogenase formation protein n=1 Tax=Ideonella livida TaxID=2707176 RepID=A0A7C9TIG6_9BURK|nr:hydrogenase formation protein [Ideonella livida]NDY89805.1 hydrogenase formation protein [Ideonella livida]